METHETPDTLDYLPATLVKEYVYCPTIAWLKANIMNEPPTPSMRYAKSLEPKLETLAPRLVQGSYTLMTRVRVRSKRLGVSGVVDAILVTGSEAIPVDAKLRVSKRGLLTRQRHLLAQLLAYALATEETLGKPVRRVAAISVEEDRVVEIHVRPWMRQWVESIAKEVRRAIARPVPPEPRNTRRCTACQIRTICPYSTRR